MQRIGRGIQYIACFIILCGCIWIGNTPKQVWAMEKHTLEASIDDMTKLLVEVDKLDAEDYKYITYQMDSFYVLSFEDITKAQSCYNKYQQKKSADIDYISKAVICETGEENYEYLSWGPEAIYADVATDKLMQKYGTVDKMPEIVVGIIDTGIDYTHDFLKDRVKSYQYDFVDEDGDARDEHRHGTHVAGIIADTTLPNVKLNAYRVADQKGEAYIDDVVEAIEQAIKDKVDIINISLGAYIEPGSAEASFFKDALDHAIDNNIVIVSAAGNGDENGIGIKADNIWPACYLEGITVASVNKNNIVSRFSNYGTMVDLCAPGEEIASSVLLQNYKKMDGTSMACPFVSASVALLLTDNPSMSYISVTDRLVEQATDLGEPGYDIHYGYGKVNLLNFTTTPILEPEEEAFDVEAIENKVDIKQIENVKKGIKLTWKKVPQTDGYYIYRKTSGSDYKKISNISDGDINNFVDVNVKNGKTYYYKVVAYIGEKEGKCVKSQKILRLSGVNITSLNSKSTRQMKITVSKNSKAYGYQIQYAAGKSFASPKTVTMSSNKVVTKTIKSLKKGKTYYVRVRCYQKSGSTKIYSVWSATKKVKVK